MTAEPTANPSPSPIVGSAPGQDEPEAAGTAEAFLHADGDAVIPTQLAASPWGPVLHGRMTGGLAARAIERVLAEDPDLICTRLTIDMFKSAPLAPMLVSTRTVRSGRRIRVLEVTVEQDGIPIGQGKFVLLRRSEQPEGTFRQTPGLGRSGARPAAGAAQPHGLGRAGRGRSGPPVDRAAPVVAGKRIVRAGVGRNVGPGRLPAGSR